MNKIKKTILSIMLSLILAFPVFGTPIAFASGFFKPSEQKVITLSSPSSWTPSNPKSAPKVPEEKDFRVDGKLDGEWKPNGEADYKKAKDKYDADLTTFNSKYLIYDYTKNYDTTNNFAQGNLVSSFIDAGSTEFAVVEGKYKDETLKKFGLADSGLYSGINFDPYTYTNDKNEVVTSENKKYLLLNAVNAGINFGMKTTSSQTLSSSSYYVVSVWVKTLGNNVNTKVSFGFSDEINASFTSINTKDTWQEMKLFIETKPDTSSKVNFELALGDMSKYDKDEGVSTGAVIFSQISLHKVSSYDYTKAKLTNAVEENIDTYSARKYIDSSSLEGDFNYTATPDTTTGKVAVDFPTFTDKSTSPRPTSLWYINYAEKILDSNKTDYLAEVYDESIAIKRKETTGEGESAVTKEVNGYYTFLSDLLNDRNNVLKLSNTSKKTQMGLKSKPLTIEQFGYYRISVWAKTLNDESTFKMTVSSDIKTGAPEPTVLTKDITGAPKTLETNKSEITNGWQEYSVYVQGNSLHNQDITLELFAGSKSEVFIDNISIERVTYSSYSNATNKLDLSPSSIMQADSIIKNGAFNYVAPEKLDIYDSGKTIYPLPAQGFTNVVSEKEIYKDIVVTSGVVPTRTELQTAELATKFGLTDNLPTRTGYNIFGMYAKEKTQYFVQTGATFSLSSDKVYKVTFDVWTSGSTNATANILFGTNIISTIKLDNSVKDWTTHTFYVQTDNNSKSLKMNFGFGDTVNDTAGNGTFFVADMKATEVTKRTEFDETTQKDKEITPNMQFTDWTKKTMETQIKEHYTTIDFLNENFTMKGETLKTNGLYEQISFDKDKESTSGSVIGILDTASNVVVNFNGETIATIKTAENTKDKPKDNSNVLVINHETASYTYLTPRITKTLSSSSYYTISVRVKTTALTGEKLTISIPQLKYSFKNIDTTAMEKDANGYTEFKVFIRTGTNSISSLGVEFSLGSKTNQTIGSAFISDIKVGSLTKDEYNTAVKTTDFNKTNLASIDYSQTTSNNAPINDTDTTALFFIVLSSLLLVAALVIALIGSGIKKLPKPNNVSGTNLFEATESDIVKSPKKKNNTDKNTPKPDHDGFI
ncbi:MAG: hypothetical protein RR334_00855 [Clostridia bacterium]